MSGAFTRNRRACRSAGPANRRFRAGSVAERAILSVKQADQSGPFPLPQSVRRLLILLGSLLAYRVRRADDLAARGHDVELNPARLLEIIHQRKGLGDGPAAGQQAMALQQHRALL